MNLSITQLKQALRIREQIDALEIELSQILGSEVSDPAPKKIKGMSAAGRARVAAAQKLRWKKLKAGKTEGPVKKRRKMSAAAKKKIGDAAKKRWAAVRAVGKTRL